MDERKHLPVQIKSFLSERAARYPDIERVILYGSRARGDARDRSDFDLAIIAPRMPLSTWSRFASEVEEGIPTLCGVDLLLLNDQIAGPLQAKIKNEGIVIYEHTA